MRIGQMTLPRVSEKADYIQLDACGLSAVEVMSRYEKYNTDKPIIVHGDWTKKGASENDILKEDRQQEYVEMLLALKEKTEVLAVTMHPPFRNKTTLEDFVQIVNKMKEQTGVPIFIENRSNSKIWVSNSEEIIELSKQVEMTIDIPQLFISCGYSEDKMIETLENCYLPNIKELHFANIMRKDGRSYVARKLYDGVLDLTKLTSIVKKTPYITFEILGGVQTFEDQVDIIKEWVSK